MIPNPYTIVKPVPPRGQRVAFHVRSDGDGQTVARFYSYKEADAYIQGKRETRAAHVQLRQAA